MRRTNHHSTARRALLTLALLGSAAACSGGDDSEAFAFADDDLCEWVSADEVAAFFASAYEWEATAEAINTSDAGPDECWWRLTNANSDDEYVDVGAGNADPGGLLPYDEVTEYEGGPVRAPGGTVSGHPALSDGVVVQSAGWGVYSFWVPPGTEHLSLLASWHAGDGEVVTGVDSAIDEQVRIEEQNRFFSFADQFLNELGWVS